VSSLRFLADVRVKAISSCRFVRIRGINNIWDSVENSVDSMRGWPRAWDQHPMENLAKSLLRSNLVARARLNETLEVPSPHDLHAQSQGATQRGIQPDNTLNRFCLPRTADNVLCCQEYQSDTWKAVLPSNSADVQRS